VRPILQSISPYPSQSGSFSRERNAAVPFKLPLVGMSRAGPLRRPIAETSGKPCPASSSVRCSQPKPLQNLPHIIDRYRPRQSHLNPWSSSPACNSTIWCPLYLLPSCDRYSRASRHDLLSGSGLDHRQNAGAEGLGQIGPCIHESGQIGVRYYATRGSNFGSSWGPDRVGSRRILR
jgi:hypothetical protein